jgi:hypothetical protein
VTKSTHVRRLGQLGLSIFILFGGLAACGDEEDEPTPTPTVAATAAATLPSSDATPQSGTGLTVGILADRIGTAPGRVSPATAP